MKISRDRERNVETLGEYFGNLITIEDFLDKGDGGQYFEHHRFEVNDLYDLMKFDFIDQVIVDSEEDDSYFDSLYIVVDCNKIKPLDFRYMLESFHELDPDEMKEVSFCIFRLWWK